MTTTLFLLQHIDRCLEVIVRSDGTRVHNNHTTLNFVLIDTTEEQTNVITSLTLRQSLTEHLNTSDDRLLILTEAKELNLITNLTLTSLDTTSSNSTTTSDREYVLNRHKERLINLTCRLLNPLIDSIHELLYRINPLWNAVQGTECRATDDRSILLISILLEELTNLHLNEFKHLLIVDHIALVQEDNDTWNVYLTSEQNVLTSLWHRTIGSSYNQDSTVHLSGTSNHVLDIVSVSRAVDVSVVTLLCLILNVCCIDGDTTLFLLRSVIDLIERLNILSCAELFVQNLRDSCSQGSLTMVNVTNSTNVYMRFGAHEFFFSHSFLSFLF